MYPFKSEISLPEKFSGVGGYSVYSERVKSRECLNYLNIFILIHLINLFKFFEINFYVFHFFIKIHTCTINLISLYSTLYLLRYMYILDKNKLFSHQCNRLYLTFWCSFIFYPLFKFSLLSLVFR